jgi:hypothetical protein
LKQFSFIFLLFFCSSLNAQEVSLKELGKIDKVEIKPIPRKKAEVKKVNKLKTCTDGKMITYKKGHLLYDKCIREQTSGAAQVIEAVIRNKRSQ